MSLYRRLNSGRVSDAMEEGATLLRRETTAPAGRLTAPGIGKHTAKHGEFIAANTASSEANVFLPPTLPSRNGDKVTVFNDGKNTAYVHASDNTTIQGWPAYPIFPKSRATMFVQMRKGLWGVIGERQRSNWPVFNRSSATVVATGYAPGRSGPFAVYMNDGRLLTGTSSLTCTPDNTGIGGRVAAESVATGLWHIFAVPTGSTEFGLIASKAATPLTAGPSGYTVYKYLWTIRIDSTGTTVVETFTQSKDWYLTVGRDYATNQVVTVSTALPTLNTWNQIDGTGLAGAGTTTTIYGCVPSGIADSVLLAHLLATSATAAQTGHVYIGPGTTVSPPYALTTNGRARSAIFTTGSGAGYTSASDAQVSEETCPIGTAGLVISFQTMTGNIVYALTHRGYRNSLYGID